MPANSESTFHSACTFVKHTVCSLLYLHTILQGLPGVWCGRVASISTAHIPLPSFHEAITFFSTGPLSPLLYARCIDTHLGFV